MKYTEKSWSELLGEALTAIATILLDATFLWTFYEYIHILFPLAAKNGVIAADLSWSDCVYLIVLFRVLRTIVLGDKKKGAKSKNN